MTPERDVLSDRSVRADQGPWTLRGQGLGLWPKVVDGPGFEDEENIEVVRADAKPDLGAAHEQMAADLQDAEAERDRLREALAELDSAHEAAGHTVTGLIGQRLRRAITEARALARPSDDKRCACLKGPDFDVDRDCPEHGDSGASRDSDLTKEADHG